MASLLCSEDNDDDTMEILDLLNFKVVNKSRSDPGCYENNFRQPSERRYYAAEYMKLRNEIDFWKNKSAESDKLVSEFERKLGNCEKDNGKLKCRLTVQEKKLTSVQNKMKEQLKRTKAKHTSDTAHIRKENVRLTRNHTHFVIDLEMSARKIRDLEAKVAEKEKLASALQQENQRVKNELEQKSNELSTLQRRMDGLQKIADVMQLNHQNAQKSLQDQIDSLEQRLSLKVDENERLVTSLASEKLDKYDAESLWRTLNGFVKSCNEDLEDNIGSFLNKCHSSMSLEVAVNELSKEVDVEGLGEEEKRLKRNLGFVSFFLQADSYQEFSIGQKKTRTECKPQQLQSSSPTLPPSLSTCTFYSFPDSGDRNEAITTRLSECTISATNSIDGRNEQLQQQLHHDPYYLPITSPVTPEGSFSGNPASPENF